jgi:hypothetical protein
MVTTVNENMTAVSVRKQPPKMEIVAAANDPKRTPAIFTSQNEEYGRDAWIADCSFLNFLQ